MSLIVDVAEGTFNHLTGRNEQLYQTRKLICQTSNLGKPCSFYNPEKDKCEHCGCPLQRKARSERHHCPLKRW